VWIISFPETQIPPQRSAFWNCGQYPKVRDRTFEGTHTWRLPAMLLGVGTTSPAVCGFPSKLVWRGWSWFLFKFLIKNCIAAVTLLFRNNLYIVHEL
jgi:hypothetical protein